VLALGSLEWIGFLRRLSEALVRVDTVFSPVLFGLTTLAVPLSLFGIRSRKRALAVIGVVNGLCGSLFVYYVKFHPVLMSFLGDS